MRRLRFSIVVAVIGGTLLLAVPSIRASTEYGDIVVAAEIVPAHMGAYGYSEYRISVSNRSVTRTYQVTLVFPGVDYNTSGHRIRQISRTVTVGPGSTVDVPLFQPSIPIYGHGLAVEIDGERQDELVPLQFAQQAMRFVSRGATIVHTPRPGSPTGQFYVFISRSVLSTNFQSLAHQALSSSDLLSTNFQSLADQAPSGGGSQPVLSPAPSVAPAGTATKEMPGGSQMALNPVPSEHPVTRWSTNWLGYSSYDGVVVTSDDLQAMPPPVQSALWRYVECGGSLIVLGSWEIPSPWNTRRKVENGLAIHYAGFGQCIVTGALNLDHLDQTHWQSITDSWSQTRVPWQDRKEAADANTAFPVVDDLGIPVRGLFFLVLLFVIISGPVNLMILSRKKKRIWLLWTIPAISLMTGLVVSAYAIISEGWSGYARTVAITILDEVSHRATTVGWAAFYTPLTPGEGLHYTQETELTPQVSIWSRSSGTARVIDWTHDQHLASGWVTARVPAHFMIRKSEARRERLALQKRGDGSLTVVNGLGADIRQLWLVDEDGKRYNAAHFAAGAQMILKSSAGSPAIGSDGVERLRQVFASDWITSTQGFSEPSAPEQLRPGSYIALLDASPFVEEGLRGVDSRTNQAVVIGIMK